MKTDKPTNSEKKEQWGKLTHSERRREWAKRFLERMIELTKTNDTRVKITLGRIGTKKEKRYFLLKENLNKILEYGNYLIVGSYAKPISVAEVVSYLIYFGNIVKKPFKQVDRKDIEKFLWEYRDHSESYKVTLKGAIKPFFRWLYGYNGTGEYPDVVKWMRCSRKNNSKKLPDILTMEEIEKMIYASSNLRDRAIISTLYESGCRAGEFLDMKIRNVSFDEYGAVIIVNGKTGGRRIRLISSVIDLKTWLNVHPRKNDADATVFCALTKNGMGSPLANVGLHCIIKRLAKKVGITKRVYPHAFRHTRATHYASHMTESQMRIYFGWSKNSPMPSVYTHLSGADIERKVLEIAGVKKSEETKKHVIPTQKCYRCGETNSIGNKFCLKCYAPLTEEGVKESERLVNGLSAIIPLILEMTHKGQIKSEELKGVSEQIKDMFKKIGGDKCVER